MTDDNNTGPLRVQHHLHNGKFARHPRFRFVAFSIMMGATADAKSS
jgi:hypothetical protein